MKINFMLINYDLRATLAQHKNTFSWKTFTMASGRIIIFRLVSQKCTLQIKKYGTLSR